MFMFSISICLIYLWWLWREILALLAVTRLMMLMMLLFPPYMYTHRLCWLLKWFTSWDRFVNRMCIAMVSNNRRGKTWKWSLYHAEKCYRHTREWAVYLFCKYWFRYPEDKNYWPGKCMTMSCTMTKCVSTLVPYVQNWKNLIFDREFAYVLPFEWMSLG